MVVLKRKSVNLMSLWASVLWVALSTLSLGFETRIVTISGGVEITKAQPWERGHVVVPSHINGRLVVGIGTSAFSGRTDVTSVDLPLGLQYIGSAAFRGSGLTSVTIPPSVNSIGISSFSNCQSLLSVDIKQNWVGQTILGNSAFAYCRSLKTVTIPSTVTSMGTRVFFEAWALDNISLGEGITNIGDRAFYDCKSLRTISIPQSVKTIEASAFSYCVNLSGVTLHEGLESIESNAFYNCGLLDGVVLPSTIVSVGSGSFYNCQLSWLRFLGDAPTVVGSFSGQRSSFHIIHEPTSSGFTSPNWNGHPTVSSDAILNVSDLSRVFGQEGGSHTIEVTASSSWNSHKSSNWISADFTGTTNFGNKTVSYSVESNLTTEERTGFITFTSTGGATFTHTITQAPLNLIVQPTSRVSANGAEYSFSVTSNVRWRWYTTVDWISSSEDTYQTGDQTFTYAVANNSSISDRTATIIFNHGDVYVTHAVTQEKDLSTALVYKFINGNSEVEITDYPEDVTGVINIPSMLGGKPVTRIGDYAFRYCKVTEILIPDSVTSIGLRAFSSCSDLRKVTIPSSVTSLGNYAFSSCKLLSSVLIPSSIKSIPRSTFSGCIGLETIDIEKGVTRIGDFAFYNCNSLLSITIPSSVTSLGDSAFQNCSALQSTYLLGDAPSVASDTYSNVNASHVIYYLSNKSGYTTPFWKELDLTMIDESLYPAADWLLYHKHSYDTSLGQDHNGDGVSLLLAYALNLNPNHRLTEHLPHAQVDDGRLTMNFYSGSQGISYIVETSKDLKSWVSTGVVLTEADADGIRTGSISLDTECGFMRLRVSEN